MAELQSGTPRTRPSLYAAIRLTCLMHHVMKRFKSRINSRRKLTAELKISDRERFKADAFENISRDLNVRSRTKTVVRTYYSRKQTQGEEPGLSALLHDLNSHAQPSGDSILKVAAQDLLFLQYDSEFAASTCTTATLSHILDLTTLVLDRLPGTQSGNSGKIGDDGCEYLKCEKLLANLEHLIRCLQQALVVALINRALIQLNLVLLHQYWQQHRQLSDEWWFAEWPNGQPPLNTTWPWNVKPSLVVLWGVCWMFYDDNDFWTREESTEGSHFGTRSPQIFTNNNNRYEPPLTRAWNIENYQVPRGDSHYALSQDQPRDSIPEFLPAYQGEYIFPTPSTTSNPFSYRTTANSALLGPPQGNDWIRVSDTADPTTDDWQQLNRQQPTHSLNTSQRISQGEAEPYGRGFEYQATADLDNQPYERTPSLKPPIQDMPAQGLPGSPILTLSAAEMSPCLPRSHVSPGAPAYPASISSIGSPNSNQERKSRLMDPVRQEDGLLHCVHADCANEPRAFSRKCEYMKHMDKHTRPYVCKERGCEKIQGFTYSGGLHRHQREVHHQHGGPKASCLCPHQDCKRSVAGRGFTRKENLTEHIRRVHRSDVDEPAASSQNVGAVDGALSSTPPKAQGLRKRRRTKHDYGDADDYDDDVESEVDPRQQVKRLRQELQLKDDRIKQLEMAIDKLKRLAAEQVTVSAAI